MEIKQTNGKMKQIGFLTSSCFVETPVTIDITHHRSISLVYIIIFFKQDKRHKNIQNLKRQKLLELGYLLKNCMLK
jgi:hypothetical protein